MHAYIYIQLGGQCNSQSQKANTQPPANQFDGFDLSRQSGSSVCSRMSNGRKVTLRLDGTCRHASAKIQQIKSFISANSKSRPTTLPNPPKGSKFRPSPTCRLTQPMENSAKLNSRQESECINKRLLDIQRVQLVGPIYLFLSTRCQVSHVSSSLLAVTRDTSRDLYNK